MKNCYENWCSRKSDVSYKHKSLPYRRDLYGEELKKDQNRVFEKQEQKADVISPKWKFLHQWIFQPRCRIKGTQNASLLKIRKPQLSHCFRGLPKDYWPDLDN